MTPGQIWGIGFLSACALATLWSLLYGMYVFAVDLARDQLRADGSSRQRWEIVGCVGWLINLASLLIWIVWILGWLITGWFGWR